MKRFLQLVSLVAILVCLSVAQQSNQSPIQAQVVVPRLIRFSGQLPGASGTVGITFTLHKGQQDNAALWIETQNVQLDGAGKYTVLLGVTKPEGIPTDLFSTGEAQWLGIEVQGRPEQPRVLLVSVPYALRAAEADTLAGHAPADFVTTDKLSSAVQQELQQQATSTSSPDLGTGKKSAIKPSAPTDPATNFIDNNTSQVVLVQQNGSGTGLNATATTGMAVTAKSAGTTIYGNNTGTGNVAGVEGVTSSTGGRGVYGFNTATTGTNFGVVGAANSTSGIGVFGSNGAASGSAVGVWGTTSSTGGVGLKGAATATTGSTTGLLANVKSSGGTAAVLQNTAGGNLISGESGSSNTQVLSVDGSGNLGTTGFVDIGGLAAPSYPLTIINGTAATGIYVSEAYSGGYGGYFVGDGYGVFGDASGFGLYGIGGSAGTVGTSGSGFGAEGSSDSNDGVHGVSDTGTGTAGLSTSGTGLYGASSSSYGVYGQSNTTYGVAGLPSTGNGVYGQISADSQGGVIGRQTNASGNWGVYAFGNIGATGTKSSVVAVDNATRQVALYAVESPNVWFEDYGSGQLASGVASIAIDPTYAQTVNTSVEYHVFLTPNGDCDGLYVSARTPTGFEVRELRKGTSNVAFSYRIIALRRGYETQRLADVTRATPRSEIVTLQKQPAAVRPAPVKPALVK